MDNFRSVLLKEKSCFFSNARDFKRNSCQNLFSNKLGSTRDPLPKIILNSRGQVWVETVIYTLIGLAVIGILLAVSKPKIEQMKDKIIIEQSIKALNEVSTRIYDVQIAPGNKRTLDLKVSKGRFYINATENRIGWILESNYKYSEIGRVVNLGNMEVKTVEGGPYIVEASVKYNVNLTYAGGKDYVEKQQSPTVYKVTIENKGRIAGNINNIDLNVL
jgi:hypothetical protein